MHRPALPRTLHRHARERLSQLAEVTRSMQVRVAERKIISLSLARTNPLARSPIRQATSRPTASTTAQSELPQATASCPTTEERQRKWDQGPRTGSGVLFYPLNHDGRRADRHNGMSQQLV